MEPSNITLTTSAPVVDCSNKADGNYPDPIGTIKPECSNRFYNCRSGISTEFNCPAGLIYDHRRNECDRQHRVFACTGIEINDTIPTGQPEVTSPPVDFDCTIAGLQKLRPWLVVIPSFGFYADVRNNCSNTFYACNGPRASELHCPEGLVFDEETNSCLAPNDVFACTGVRKTTPVPPTTMEPVNITATPSPMDCVGIPDGIYPDPLAKCSREFYFCAHNVSFRTVCPANLFYSAELKRCDLWLNVFECSGIHPTSPQPPTPPSPPPTVPTTDFDCSRLDNGMYVNPKNNCSKFYYFCSNMQAYQQYCPADLFYDPDRFECASWIHVFACSGQTQAPSTPVPSPGTLASTEKPIFDCSPKLDGLYEHPDNSCSHIYFECSGGIAYEFHCPADLYFSIISKQCDYYENVFACSGKTPGPTTTTIPVSKTTPAKLPIDCSSLENGDYEDPEKNCSDKFYTCGGGIGYVRSCPPNTRFDAEFKICNIPSQVPACTGKPRPTTQSGPVTTHTPRPTYPFDCTKRYNGYYPDGNCSSNYWSCNGGLATPHHCAPGTIYDSEFNRCEFPHLLPECGGERITTSTKSLTTTSKPLPLDCTFLEDGAYPDPEANCSHIFYKCSNGKASVNPCPEQLFYDAARITCDYHDQVPACVGEVVIPTIATSPISEISTSIAPTGSVETGSTALPEVSTSLGPIETGATGLPELSTSLGPIETTVASQTTAASMGTVSTGLPELTTGSIETGSTGLPELTTGSLETGTTGLPESTTMGPIGNETTVASQTTAAMTGSVASETPSAETSTAAASTALATGGVPSTASLETQGSTSASNETTLIPTSTMIAPTGTVPMVNESSAATQPIGESSTASGTQAIVESTTAHVTESATSGMSLPPAETTTGHVTELATATASLSETTAGNVTELATGTTMIGETTPVSGTESVTSGPASLTTEAVTNAPETSAATAIITGSSLPAESTPVATSGLISTESSTIESVSNTTAAVNTQPEGTVTSGLTTAGGNATEQQTTAASTSGIPAETTAASTSGAPAETAASTSAIPIETAASTSGIPAESTAASTSGAPAETAASTSAIPAETTAASTSGIPAETTAASTSGIPAETTAASELSTGLGQNATEAVSVETSAKSEAITTAGPAVSGAMETTASQHVTELSSLAAETTSASGLTSTVAPQNATETPANETTVAGSESPAVGTTAAQLLTSTSLENATTAIPSETSLATGSTIVSTTGIAQNATTISEISTSGLPELISTLLNNSTTEAIGTGSPPPPPTSP